MPSWKEYQIPWDWSCEWLWAIMWVSGIELRSSARKASVLIHHARPRASDSPSSTCVLGPQACVLGIELRTYQLSYISSPSVPVFEYLLCASVYLATAYNRREDKVHPLTDTVWAKWCCERCGWWNYVLSTLLHVHCHLVGSHLGGRVSVLVSFHTFGGSDT